MTILNLSAKVLYRVAFELAQAEEKLPSALLLTRELRKRCLLPDGFSSLESAFKIGQISGLEILKPEKPISSLGDFYLASGLGVKEKRHIVPNPGAPKPEELSP